jgi:hypothetical protein
MGDISGIRAVMGVKAALADAGLGRKSKYAGGEIAGWIPDNRFGSTGFSIRPRPDGGLDWHIIISGKPHLRYTERIERRDDEETIELHEPQNRASLHPAISKVFEKLGIKVREIDSKDYQTHWDDDVGYEIATDVPEWLDTKDQSNSQKKNETEYTLCACQTGRTDRCPHSNGAVPAYRDLNGFYFLTKETIDVMIRSAKEANKYSSNKTTMAVSDDGVLTYKRDGNPPLQQASCEIENFWGDRVKVWPVPGFWIEPLKEFVPIAPFVMKGKTLTEAPFAEIDAQNGGVAPWLERQAPAPTP